MTIDYHALARQQALDVRKRRQELLAQRTDLVAAGASERELWLHDQLIGTDEVERWWLTDAPEFMRKVDEAKGKR